MSASELSVNLKVMKEAEISYKVMDNSVELQTIQVIHISVERHRQCVHCNLLEVPTGMQEVTEVKMGVKVLKLSAEESNFVD